jgi:hypothetical protein
MHDARSLYRQCRQEIRPVMEMLKHKQTQLGNLAWEEVVLKTRKKVLKSPKQYFSDLPERQVLTTMIDQLFEEFKKEVS